MAIFIENQIYLRQDGSNIQYSPDNSTGWTNITSWPVTFNRSTDTGIIYFTNTLVMDSTIKYFICGNTNLTFNGQNNEVTVTVSDYPGLIQNGTNSLNGYNNLIVQSISVNNDGGSLQSEQGWIGQSFFSKNVSNCVIRNCSSNGVISDGSGGIIGRRADGNLNITDCFSTGNIGITSGGICGPACGSINYTININYCFSTGNLIGNFSGGIGGFNSRYITINKCFSTGSILGNGSGGIFGHNALNCSANYCYSTGNISGERAGGIFGEGPFGICTSNNCYTIGSISVANSGGIFGSGTLNNMVANNCYTGGSTNQDPPIGGIFAGSSNDTKIGSSNNYSRINNGNTAGWSIVNVISVLEGIPSYGDPPVITNRVGPNWVDVSPDLNNPNIPYLLYDIGYTPYSKNLDKSYSTVAASGGITVSSVNTLFNTYEILSVNDDLPEAYPDFSIDTDTGSVSVGSSAPLATYNLYIRSYVEPNVPYSISQLEIEVLPFVLYSSESNPTYIRQVGSDIQYRRENDTPDIWTTLDTWPVNLVNEDTITRAFFYLTTDITITSADKYFIFSSENITFEGETDFSNLKTVTIDGVTNPGWPGLFQNGTETDAGYNNITISKIKIESENNSDLWADDDDDDDVTPGWLCWGYFGNGAINILIEKIWNNAPFTIESAGGIVGERVGYNGGEITIQNCLNSGNIASYGGGIVGRNAGDTNGTVNIIDCQNNGNIGEYGGGIIGERSASNSGNVYAINCINQGEITQSGAGGIFGFSTAPDTTSNCRATNCKNQSNIIGLGSGGIFANVLFGNCQAINCSNSGNILGENCGGIFGSETVFQINSFATAEYCYNTGDIEGQGAGGIFGGNCGKRGIVTAEYCYNTGNITGLAEGAGGIYGKNAGFQGGRANAISCYSQGNILGQGAGGIFGMNSGRFFIPGTDLPGKAIAENCYSTGDIGQVDGGGIFGNNYLPWNIDNLIGSRAENCYNCSTKTSSPWNNLGGIFSGIIDSDPSGSFDNYTELSQLSEQAPVSWDAQNAANTLLNTPQYNDDFTFIINRVGDYWVDVSPNDFNPSTPYELFGLGYSPYNNDNVNLVSLAINAGQSTTGNVSNFTTFRLLGINNSLPENFPSINLNTSNAIISTSSNLPAGIYNIVLRSSGSPYSISSLELSVSNDIICYNEDTTVLIKENNEYYYRNIKDLKVGDNVFTYIYGLKSIKMIGKKQIRNGKTDLTSMYKIEKYDNMTHDLIVSGSHGLLVDKLPQNIFREIEKYKKPKMIGKKYRIIACKYDKATKIDDNNKYTLYHLVLDGFNSYYGIYVNGGLLSESTTEKDFKNFGFKPLS